MSVSLQKRVNERLAAAGAPNAFMGNPLGYGMGGPTLLEHGTPEQHQRYLRPLFTHEEIWCQLFSEPGAGSDLAGVATRAERDGDDWVINGQKVWTSWGHVARWGMLVARTDPQAVKHRGLTYFLCDMHAPGVEVRPLRQMTGNAEFNEVYFTDVRLSDELRIGAVGGGWGVALTTLNNERYMLSEGLSAVPALHQAIDLWNRRARQDLGAGARRYATRCSSSTSRSRSTASPRCAPMWPARTAPPARRDAVAKLSTAQLNKKVTSLAVDLMGADGMLHGSYDIRDIHFDGSGESDAPVRAFLRARANTIEGGTSEILRNILGERVLGLPADIRVDKNMPWIESRRS